MGDPISSYWNTQGAHLTLVRITDYEDQHSYRPTVVVPIIDHAGRPLIVRHDNPEGNWGLVQGHIEPYDADPVATCRREAYEEAFVTDQSIDLVFPFIHEENVEGPRLHQTGYSKGGFYVCVGIKLKAGADVSILPPPGLPRALHERRWCSSLDQAIALLREQPGVEKVSSSTREKVERVLIPALESIYQPHVQDRSESINYDYVHRDYVWSTGHQ